MSLANDLLEKGIKGADKALGKLDAERISELLDKLKAKIPTEEDGQAAVVRGMSTEALNRLKKHAPSLVGHTREGLAVFLSYAALNDADGATAAWLREAAGPQELVTALLDAGDAAVAERKAREALIEAAKETVLEILQDIGPLAARYLLPLLLQAAR